MACDATARLYDVDEDSVVFRKLDKTAEYDQGTVTFNARQGKLIDLDKLHESVWATRLSRGTSSGLVSLEVVAIGQIVVKGETITLHVTDNEKEFVLAKHSDEKYAEVFAQLSSHANKRVKLSGLVDKYSGRWPGLLQQPVTWPRQLLVTSVEEVP